MSRSNVGDNNTTNSTTNSDDEYVTIRVKRRRHDEVMRLLDDTSAMDGGKNAASQTTNVDGRKVAASVASHINSVIGESNNAVNATPYTPYTPYTPHTSHIARLSQSAPAIPAITHGAPNTRLVNSSIITPTYYNIDSKVWTAPSSLRNHVHGDPILDWLDRHGRGIAERAGYPVDSPDFINYLRQRGIEFENRVWGDIKRRFPQHTRQICKVYTEMFSERSFVDTKRAIAERVPIIYQASLHDFETKRYGSPDLIVLRSWLPRIVPSFTDREFRGNRRAYGKRAAQDNDYYVIVDIKFMTLMLRADGDRLLNGGSTRYYKVQCMLYNDILTKIQGMNAPYAYLLGRGYNYKRCGETYSGASCYDALGEIDFLGDDAQYRPKLEAAIKWIKRVRTEGHAWQVLPHPSVTELYPNMANTHDYPNHGLKQYIAEQLKEITLLWGCGLRQRELAFGVGIRRYNDKRLTAKTMGFNGPVKSRVLQAMLEHNHEGSPALPIVIRKEARSRDWYGADLEFFVDFETTSSAFDDLARFPAQGGIAMIFMVGVGYVYRGTWHYRCFSADRLTRECESQIIREFMQYIDEVCKLAEFSGEPNVYHWSHAEPSQIINALSYVLEEYECNVNDQSDGYGVDDSDVANVKAINPRKIPRNFILIDMLQVFKDDLILVKGVLDFSLKSIARGMAKHGLIADIYAGGMGDGTSAMVAGHKCYSLRQPPRGLAAFKQIIDYNEKDCRVIWEIVKYLRVNVVQNRRAM